MVLTSQCPPPGGSRRRAIGAVLGILLAVPVRDGLAAPRPAVRWVDATAASGLRFVHRAAPTPEKYLPETMGAGVVMIDHDRDGDLDLYFVQGGSAAPGAVDGRRANELWRNDGSLRFTKVESGAGDTGLGMGACAGDVDGDGDADLLVTNVGPNALYLNDGGRFRLAPDSGIAGSDWSTSCTFFDMENDGDLDAYVVAYVDFDARTKNPYCGDARAGRRAYCHPDVFQGVRDTLWRNDGRGRFEDVTAASGMERATGKGLGVVATDHDEDGDTDLYVANDSTPNFLWRNDGRGRFTDIGLLSGTALDESGKALAGMGVAAADLDGKGGVDLFVTNLDLQTNTVYLATGRGTFVDATVATGVAATDHAFVGFGTEAFDADFDGDVDLFVANGHIIDNIAFFNPALTHAQPLQYLENQGGGRFREAGPAAGDPAGAPCVARGCAAGDLDGDGDLDVVVTVNDGPARLLRNDGGEKRPHLVLSLRGTRSNRDALGARAEVFPRGASGGRPLARAEVQGGRSYLSQGTPLLHVACSPGGADVRVTWPGGRTEWWRGLASGRRHELLEGAAPAPPAPPPPRPEPR